jgi:hypothetical protein
MTAQDLIQERAVQIGQLEERGCALATLPCPGPGQEVQRNEVFGTGSAQKRRAMAPAMA